MEDSSEGNMLITKGSPMVIDEVQQQERGVKRPRKAQDEDDGPPSLQTYEEEEYWRCVNDI